MRACDRFFLILLIAGTTARADLVWEQRTSDTNGTRTATLKLRGDMMRLDQPADSLSVICDLKTRDSFTLLTTNKTYLRRFGNEVRWEMEEEKKYHHGTNEMDRPPAPPADTGKSENVAGRDTTVFQWTGARGIAQKLWVDTNFPNYKAIRAELARVDLFNDTGPHRNAQPMLSRLPGMVLKSETVARGLHVTNELISVKLEPVDASLFNMPHDYTEWKRPEKKAP